MKRDKILGYFDFHIQLVSLVILIIGGLLLSFFDNNIVNLSSIKGQIGLMFVLFGFLLRVFATKTAKYMDAIKVTGIYAFCRQPMLLAAVFIFVGFNVIVYNIKFIPISIVIFALINVLSAFKQESFMSYYFRDVWPIYKKNTGMILPFPCRVYDLLSIKLTKNHDQLLKNIVFFITIYSGLILFSALYYINEAK